MMRILFLALSASHVAAEARKPIISTDILYGTYDLFYDIYDAAYGALIAAHVSKHSPKVYDAIDQGLTKMTAAAGMKNEDVYAKIDTAKAKASDLKANVVVHKEAVHSKLNDQVVKLVDAVEKSAPRYAGVLPRNFADFVFFLSYAVFVLYVFFVLAKFSFKVTISTFCFVCCCGCCRSKSGVKKDAKKVKNAEANAKKAANKKK